MRRAGIFTGGVCCVDPSRRGMHPPASFLAVVAHSRDSATIHASFELSSLVLRGSLAYGRLKQAFNKKSVTDVRIHTL
jgi:hypothetical protein